MIAVYLFGSIATRTAGPGSDVDVAVLPEGGVADRLALVGRVASAASEAFGRERADVVLLDEVPPALAFQAIRGELLLDRDPAAREEIEARILSSYHDRRYYEDRWERETLARWKRGEFA